MQMKLPNLPMKEDTLWWDMSSVRYTTDDMRQYAQDAGSPLLEALHKIATYDPTKLDAATLANIARVALVEFSEETS